jgi:hypothetical protein
MRSGLRGLRSRGAGGGGARMASICQGGGVRGRRGRRWRTPRVSMEDIGGHRWRMTSGVAVGGSRGQKGGAVGGAPESSTQRRVARVGGGAGASSATRGLRQHEQAL